MRFALSPKPCLLFFSREGCLIKGETMHFEYICEAVTQGIMRVNLDTRVPVLFGVLTVMTAEQAFVRAGLVKGKEDKNEGKSRCVFVLMRCELDCGVKAHVPTDSRALGADRGAHGELQD